MSSIYLFAEVTFYFGQRKTLPPTGYRPDAIFNAQGDYWGITFIHLPVVEFDAPAPATFIFTFQENHYKEVTPGQKFRIMEGARQVGEGRVLSLHHEKEN